MSRDALWMNEMLKLFILPGKKGTASDPLWGQCKKTIMTETKRVYIHEESIYSHGTLSFSCRAEEDLLHLFEPHQHTYMRHAQALFVSAVDLYRAH
jgi:hypothetical protein